MREPGWERPVNLKAGEAHLNVFCMRLPHSFLPLTFLRICLWLSENSTFMREFLVDDLSGAKGNIWIVCLV
jgi:hypothetical protein